MDKTINYLKNFFMESSELLIVALIALLSYFIVKKVIVSSLHRFFKKTENTYDDLIIESGIFGQLAMIAPALVFIYSADIIKIPHYLIQIISAYIAANITIFFIRLFTLINKVYNQFEVSAKRPIKGYIQLMQVITAFLGIIITICIGIGKSPLGILSGLGAMTAVLMFVFKDTIMCFIAGLQIVFNDLLHNGDWIEMPNMGADGEVMDIALYTVRVRNFDKTIVTIPTSKFLDSSFKNWRGMTESGGRRIKRSISIDQSTVRFLDRASIEKFSGINLIKDYMDQKLHEDIDAEGKDINKRKLTNLGTFRVYIKEYLKNNPKLHKDMTLIVRQLPSGSEGLPIEIYVFTTTTNWSDYEDIQSDIFDHLTAAVKDFDLRIFQHPSGYDFSKLGSS